MRIIMDGDPSKKMEQKAKCKNCGCEFAYTEDDVKKVFFGPYKETATHCPYCGKYLILTKERVNE